MSTFRLTSVCALAVLTVAVASGCSDGDRITTSSLLTTSSALTAPSTTVTSVAASSSTTAGSSAATLGENDRREEAYVSWSPAETIPAAELELISQTLASRDHRMLFPSALPVANAGPTSGDFLLYRTPATGVIDLWVRVETEDSGLFVAVNSSADYSWIVDWGLETVSGAVDVTVRGLPGRSYPPSDESLPMVYWEEEGQYYVAAYRGWSVEVTAQQIVDWLDSWYMLP